MKLLSGHTVVEVSNEEQVQQAKDFKANGIGTIRLYPGGWFFLKTFQKFADRLYNFKVRPTDIFLVTYPKCGTTWMQEIVWTMKNNQNLTNPEASIPINIRCPFFDFDYIISNPYLRNHSKCANNHESSSEILEIESGTLEPSQDDSTFIQMAENLKDPRIIKTHLPLSFLSKNLLDTCKVIYIARNPKDVCVSFHHHCRLLKAHDFVGTMDTFIEHFLNDTLLYSPFWGHVKEAWNMRSHPNMHFMFYEDMKANTKKEIEGLNAFLETGLTEKQIEDIVEYTSFKEMKTRNNLLSAPGEDEDNFINTEVSKNDGGFFRKGQAGDFKNKLTKSQEHKIDLWMEANTTGTNLKFKYS